jgi:hypothetical protein
MTNLPDKPVERIAVKWKTLKPDILLILVAITFPIISFYIDFHNNRSDWFYRSGAITTIIGIVLAYRSLKKHYQKFPTDLARKEALASMVPQLKVDGWTMVLSIIGTLIWSYGDKFFQLFFL